MNVHYCFNKLFICCKNKNRPARFIPNANSFTALKSHHESPLDKSHSCLSHYYKTINHNQGTLFFLCRCGQTHTDMHTHRHTELFPDKGLWLGLVCGLLLCLYWRQWDSVQYTCPTTKHRAALWRDAVTWLRRSRCNPSFCASVSSSLRLPPSLLCTFTLSPLAPYTHHTILISLSVLLLIMLQFVSPHLWLYRMKPF